MKRDTDTVLFLLPLLVALLSVLAIGHAAAAVLAPVDALLDGARCAASNAAALLAPQAWLL